MGYNVQKLHLYSMDDNKVYIVDTPESNRSMFEQFEVLIRDINSFKLDGFKQTNLSKCKKCIYEPLCSFSVLKGDVKSVYLT